MISAFYFQQPGRRACGRNAPILSEQRNSRGLCGTQHILLDNYVLVHSTMIFQDRY